MTRAARFALALLVAAVAGCESRYADLLEPQRTLDTVPSERSRSWIGYRQDRTYVLVVSGDRLEREGAMAVARLDRSGDVFLLVGVYRYDGQRSLDLDVSTRFRWLRDEATPFLAREGAVRESLFPPEPQGWSFVVEDDGRTFLGPPDAAAVELLDVGDVFERLVDRGSFYPRLVARLLHVPLQLAQVRIPRFGGFGMAEYLDLSPVRYPGLLGGEAVLSVTAVGAPVVRVDLEDARQLTDLVADGRWQQETNLSGRGAQAGRLEVRLEGRSVPARWILDVGGVAVEQGLPAAGSVAWTGPGVAEPRAVSVPDWLDLELSELYELVR